MRRGHVQAGVGDVGVFEVVMAVAFVQIDRQVFKVYRRRSKLQPSENIAHHLCGFSRSHAPQAGMQSRPRCGLYPN